MKMFKSLLICSMVAGFAAAASAQTEIYIAGSTAYRGATTKAIQDLLFTSGTGFAEGEAASPVYGASAALFKGTIGGQSYVIHTYWTGSLAGAVDVATSNVLTKWIPDTGTTANITATPTTTSTSIAAYADGALDASPTISAVPNIANSDSFNFSVANSLKGSVTTTGTIPIKTIIADVNNNLSQAQGNDGETVTGVLPFVWVAGAVGTTGTSAATTGTASAPFSNLTQEAASQLIQFGYVPITAVVTGTALQSDTNDYAFLVGRNEDSGTRICAQAEAQVGSAFGATSFGRSMKQYYAIFTGTAGGAYANASTDGVFVTGTLGAAQGHANNGTLQGASIQDGGVGSYVSDIGLWPPNAPLNTETSITWADSGHSGQIGGGDVAKMLEAGNPLTLNISAVDIDVLGATNGVTGPNTNGYTTGVSAPDNWIPGTSKAYLIGYLGTADAGGIPTSGGGSGAKYLSYNGVPYSPVNIQNGSYDFWSFEHTYINPNVISSQASTFAGELVDQLYTQDCQTDSSGFTDLEVAPADAKVGGLIFNNVPYSKSQEGAAIAPLF